MDRRFITVMQWDSCARRTYVEQEFRMSCDAFGPCFRLPTKIDAELELDLGTKGAPRDDLRGYGWLLRDPLGIIKHFWAYRRYV